ncbi:hypothetical protein DMN91_011031 [Ooceraea biroi]|uniref:Uncharacterized protein n=1 Tax=Ooceraea biroi TaxID=2015173 RepID=A0A3L8D9Z0_OOCBI|nr:putative uncharacterized protein DDB_G0277255 isoform X3 [Ooceraea biroi]RLU16962.1 hypothetical protein DMN91_011031 [Ooceraea biroi]
MGQCVSRKAGAVVAASGHHNSPSYRIMDKAQKQGDLRGSSKRGASHTRGTAMSFGFRRRPASGIPMPITSYTGAAEKSLLHPRSKSAGPEQDRRRMMDDDCNCNAIHNSSSGRSTPRLAPPKKDSSGIGVRTNRFGYRQPQGRTLFTNKVGDICSNHTITHYNQEKVQQLQQQYNQQQQAENYFAKQTSRASQHLCGTAAPTKPRPSPSNNVAYSSGGNSIQHTDVNKRASGIPEPITRYTLHTSHLPLPQFAVRVNDSNSKIAKTAANQSRKISTSTQKGSGSSKEGSMTEDSGVSSQPAGPDDNDRIRSVDFVDEGATRRRGVGRPRNLRMVVNGKSFDVRDVRDDDSTVTEISVIPLPKSFVSAANLNTGFVRERATQYQRIVSKDNRYTDSTASMSTTSSEGYDEGCLSEEKVYKDRSHTEKIPSIKSDFSPPSSDDPEYGHGEAMADEYSLSSSDECQRSNSIIAQHAQPITQVTAKNGAASKNALRSVLLTIEDPAFAAAAATTTTLIDDETSPVDSLFDSPTASITQSDGKPSKKDEEHVERSDNTLEDDSPGTPTNASNSLSLSEGREFFDDEIADQPGLIFDDNNSRVRAETQSAMGSQIITENSHTLIETSSKTSGAHVKGMSNSPHHGQRLHRTGSVDTLSPCESIASDDLMLDYDASDASSYEEQQRLNSNPALHELDDATIISELEAQGEEVMRQWSSLLSTAHMQEEANSNTANNNSVNSGTGNNNNQTTTESGIGSDRMSRLFRSRSGTESPRSLDNMRNRQVSSPMRSSGNVSRISSPCVDSGDEASLRIDRGTYQYMFQDIVSIKTMLLKLKRILQETETLNPFDNAKNGLFCNLNEGGTGTIDVSTSPGSGGSSIADELADLRRQVVFLQGQVEDRDRTIQLLEVNNELQMSKLQGPKNGDVQNCILPTRNISSVDTCNAATQTEKTRPVSAGPSLLQSLPQDGVMGPLVSWSDSSDRQRPSLLSELNSAGSPRKPIERLPHTLRLRQEQAPARRGNAHTRRHSSESVTGSPRSKDCAKPPCDSNDMEQRDAKIEGNTVKSLIPTPRKLRL